METRYYHGVAGGISSLSEEEILNESLRVLKSIFKYKSIYCRSILRMYKMKYPIIKILLIMIMIIFPYI